MCWMPSPAEPHQKFLDLAGGLARFLVQRDADQAVRGCHGLGRQPRVFALDVEVPDLAEIEQPLVKGRPVRHATPVDVVRQMVHDLQATPRRMPVHAFDELEVDVVDGLAIFVAIDQVQGRPADALDRRQSQLHRAGGDVQRLGAKLQGALVGLVRILHAEGQAAGRGAVLLREVGCQAPRFLVDDEVDVPLTEEGHVLRSVPGHQLEAHLFEEGLQQAGRRRCEFDELEARKSHGVEMF